MKKKLLLVMLVVAWSVTIASAQQGTKISLSSFHTIKATGNIELILKPASAENSIEIELFDLKTRNFKYGVEKGELSLEVFTGLFVKSGYARVVVSVDSLSRIFANGASIECLAPIRGESFSFATRGSKHPMALRVDVDRLLIEASGVSDIAVRGRADNSDFRVLQNSRVDAVELSVDTLLVRAFEGSEVYAMCNEKLTARISTASTLYYGGEAEVQKYSSLAGALVKLGRDDLMIRRFKGDANAQEVELFTDEEVKRGTPSSTTVVESKDADFF